MGAAPALIVQDWTFVQRFSAYYNAHLRASLDSDIGWPGEDGLSASLPMKCMVGRID